MEWKRNRERFMSRTHLFYLVSIYFFFFFSACALLIITISTIRNRTVHLDIRSTLSSRKADGFFQQDLAKIIEKREDEGEFSTLRLRRRYLSFPGSSPPRCKSKCGKCTPCKAVRVSVPPGTPVTTMEYYPEAWRCKCGKYLYIP